MTYATHLMLVLTSLSSIDRELKEEIERVLDGNLERLQEIVLQYLLSEVTPGSTFDFEQRLAEQVRELARHWSKRGFVRANGALSRFFGSWALKVTSAAGQLNSPGSGSERQFTHVTYYPE